MEKSAPGYSKQLDKNLEVYNSVWPEFSAQEDCIKEASCVKSPRKFSIDKRGAFTVGEISVNRDSGTYNGIIADEISANRGADLIVRRS